MTITRIESAETGLAKALKWSVAELSKEHTRGNYASTRARMSKMISDAEQLIKNLKSAINDEDDDSSNFGTTNTNIIGGTAISDIVSQCISATISTLVDKGMIKPSDPTSTARKKRQATPTPAPTTSDDDESADDTETQTATESASTDIIPECVRQQMQKEQNPEKEKGYVDYKTIIKRYSIAIDALAKFESKNDATTKCKDYIVRWFKAIHYGFKNKITHLGATKICDTIGKLIAAFGTSFSRGKMDSFDRSFDKWEEGVLNGINHYGAPAVVSKFIENNMNSLTDSESDIVYSIYDEIYKSNVMHVASQIDNHGDDRRFYLGSSLLDSTLVACES